MIACLSAVGFMTGGLGQVDAHSDVATAAFTAGVSTSASTDASTDPAAGAAPSGDQTQAAASQSDQNQAPASQGDQGNQNQAPASQTDQNQAPASPGDQNQAPASQGDQGDQGQSDQTSTPQSSGTPRVTARGPKKESTSFHGPDATPAPSPTPVTVTTLPAGESQVPSAPVSVTAAPAPAAGVVPTSSESSQPASPKAYRPGRTSSTESAYAVSQIQAKRPPASLVGPARSLLAPLAPAPSAARGGTASQSGIPGLRGGAGAGARSVQGTRGSAGPATQPSPVTTGPAGASAPARPAPRRPATGADNNSSLLLVPMKFIPRAVWLALGISLALAVLGTGAAVAFGRRMRRQAGQIAQVSAAALMDPLTGVLNRRGFTEAVERELARSRRYRRPFVLAYGDVRGLKAVNDSEGHLAGDALLKTVASMLTGSARAHDVVGRLGGDEFAVLLPEQSSEDALAVTDRIAEQVQARRDDLGFGVGWDLTVGIACFPEDGSSFDELLAAADRRLYRQRGIALAAR